MEEIINNLYNKTENGIFSLDAKYSKIEKFLNLTKKQSDISVFINNNKFTEFNSLRITYSIDSACSAFSFNTIFYPNKGTSNTIKPFGNENIEIKYKGNTIFLGKIEKLTPGYGSDGSNLNIQGRSKGGLLVDSDIIPTHKYNTNLKTWVESCGYNFIDFEPNETLPLIDYDRGENAFDTISKYASQKGLWAIPKYNGNLLFKKISSLTSEGIKIQDGKQNVLGISASFDVTKRFSNYIGLKKNSIKELKDLSMPERGLKYYRANDIISDLNLVAQKAFSKSISESFSLNTALSTWTYNDKLIQPGMIISVISPMNMIYSKLNLCVKQIDYTYNISDGYVCELQLVLPESYTGESINANLFGTYVEKFIGIENFLKIPDSKDIYENIKSLKI